MSVKAIAFEPNVTVNRRKKRLPSWDRIVELFAVIVTCFFVYQQSTTMAEQSTTMAEQSKTMAEQEDITVALFLREHYQTINKILVEQPDLAKNAFGIDDIKDVLGYMLISDYDVIYQMRHDKWIKGNKWKALHPFIRQTMMDDKLKIRELWKGPGNRGRSPEFQEYVDACVYSDHLDSNISPANPGIIDIVQNQDGEFTKNRRIPIQRDDCPELLFQ